MAKKKPEPSKRDAEWAEAKRRCRLSAEDIRMAKELGLSPPSLIKNIPSPSQKWKAPVKDWIRDLYRAKQEKAAPKRAHRQPEEEPVADTLPAEEYPPATETDWPDLGGESEAELEGEFDDLFGRDELTDEDVDDTNRSLLLRQQQFRQAAEQIAQALAELPQVRKVVLFGSVAVPLWKEVPRFHEYRRAGRAVWHECKDVDLAVWVSDLDDLKSLQRARGQALNVLFQQRQIGIAHHQVDMFLMEPGTDRYLGRLCIFGQCPKGKPECLVAGCGRKPFLQQHEDFVLKPEALAPDKTIVLFDREAAT